MEIWAQFEELLGNETADSLIFPTPGQPIMQPHPQAVDLHATPVTGANNDQTLDLPIRTACFHSPL